MNEPLNPPRSPQSVGHGWRDWMIGPGCIIATRGYDFREGQVLTKTMTGRTAPGSRTFRTQGNLGDEPSRRRQHRGLLQVVLRVAQLGAQAGRPWY